MVIPFRAERDLVAGGPSTATPTRDEDQYGIIDVVVELVDVLSCKLGIPINTEQEGGREAVAPVGRFMRRLMSHTQIMLGWRHERTAKTRKRRGAKSRRRPTWNAETALFSISWRGMCSFPHSFVPKHKSTQSEEGVKFGTGVVRRRALCVLSVLLADTPGEQNIVTCVLTYY